MATTKRLPKPEVLRAKIAALEAELHQAERAEHERMQQELLSLLDRTHALARALEWARGQARSKQAQP